MAETSQGVNSVDIAVNILTFIASQNGQARAIDIAAGCNLSESFTQVSGFTLSNRYVGAKRKGLYCLGSTLFQMAGNPTAARDPVSELNTALIAFRDTFNHSTGVVVAMGDGLVLKHYHRSFRNVDIDFLPNTPFRCTPVQQVRCS